MEPPTDRRQTMSVTTKARQIATEWESKVGKGDFRPRVWAPESGTMARVYSGYRGEYVQVHADLSVSRSQSRLRWGSELDEALASLEG